MSDYNWAADRLLPVGIQVQDRGLLLQAGGDSISFSGPLFGVDSDRPLRAEWSVEDGAVTVLSLHLTAEQDTLLRRVTWLPGEWEAGCERVVNRTDLQDNAVFLRKGDVSFFLTLDFPYSEISTSGISYPPYLTVPARTSYACHTLSIGACQLSGEFVGDLDQAEIEAFSTYIERRYPQRFERPMFLSACITNRMTDVREGRVFYSMYDNPTLFLDPELLEEDIRLCADVGIEYYQVFEGVFDWPDVERTGRAYRRVKSVADGLGVRLGGYVDPNGPYCPHYNYEHRTLDRPEWEMRDSEGHTTGRMCLGHAEYASFLSSRLVEHAREYGEELICFDFLGIRPCFAEDHGHPPGDVYRQVLHLVELMQNLATTNPQYLVWSNSGNWVQFMPKLTWWNPNVYLTDPHVREYSPTLNILKLLGDSRREQMVTLHERYGIPYRAFTNCEYYAFPRSRVPDHRVFEYSLLQGLAVTPNLCLGELRPLLNRVSSSQREYCLAFIRKWTDFVRSNFDVWKHTLRVGDPPGVGSCELYAHIAGDRGFVCLVNQNPFPRVARFRLNGSIGLAGNGPYRVWEIYPRECPLSGQTLPVASFGDEIACTVPAHGVRYLEIRPPRPAAGLQVYGHPAQVEDTAGGYRVRLSAPQGEIVNLGLVFPAGQTLDSVVARQTPTVPMFSFPVEAAIVERKGNVGRMRVSFPRRQAPRELTRWRVEPGGVEVQLPQLGGSSFLGGLVSGAFSEDYEVELDITVGATAREGLLPAAPPVSPQQGETVPWAPHQTFVTQFDLPFIETPRWGNMPGYGDDTVVELAFSDSSAVASIEAQLNGRPVPVLRYPYPRRPEWWSYYVELTGVAKPGPTELSVDVTWPDVDAPPGQ